MKGRIASDLVHKLSTDTDFRMYGAYLEYSLKRALTLRAGRQYMYAGLGGFTMDGGRVDLTIRRHLMLTAYGGSTPGPTFYDFDKVNDWSKSNAYGGHIKYSIMKTWTVGASYLQQRFRKATFVNAEGDTLHPQIWTDSQLGSLDISYSRNYCSAFGRADYDFIFKRVKMITVMPSFKMEKGHSIGFEYTYRRPTLPFSNMFSVFDGKPYHQVRVNPVYKINRDLYALGGAAWTKYSDAHNIRLNAGASYKGQSGGLVFARGYEGVKLGVFGYLYYQMKSGPLFYLSGDAFNYKLDANADKTIGNVAASLGTKFKIIDGFASRAEVQMLTNAQYKYDTRFYLKLEYAQKTIYGTTEYGGESR